MNSPNKIDSALDNLLPESSTEQGQNSPENDLGGKFQELSSLGGYLGVYETLTNPSKEDLISALSELGVRNSAEDSVYDFLLFSDETTKGFIRSKNGDWSEQKISDFSSRSLQGGYPEYTKLASFLGLYDKYGLDRPTANKLKQALTNYGVQDTPKKSEVYLAPLEGESGTVHTIGISIGEVTTAYPVDSDGERIGDDEYTHDLLPKLSKRLESGSQTDDNADIEQFVASLPNDTENLLENSKVAENYQLIMHRIADQAARDGVSNSTRQKKLAEARFITEVLSGERTWEQ